MKTLNTLALIVCLAAPAAAQTHDGDDRHDNTCRERGSSSAPGTSTVTTAQGQAIPSRSS